MKIENEIIYPDEGNHLKNIKSGEIYPGYIVPAKSLTESDFIEVSEEEYQAYIIAEEEISAEEAIGIITEGS
jgi:hypothetical protein